METVWFCHSCGDYKQVEYTENPFAAEIHDNHEKHFFCADCLQEMRDDI